MQTGEGRSQGEMRSLVARPSGPLHVRSLDGLRFFAFLAVFVLHAYQGNKHLSRVVGYGGLGVSVFFVLSGFLIGGGLLEVRRVAQSPLRSSVRPFYIRRALRIFPLYYMALGLLLLLQWAGEDAVGGSDLLPWNLTYTTNVKFYVDGNVGGSLAHLWSLSVEEHFYLIAPLVILTLTTRQLSWVCVGTWIAAAAGRMFFWWNGDYIIGVLSPFPFDCLTVGIAAAIVQAEGNFLGVGRDTVLRISRWALAAAVVVLLLRQFQDQRIAGLLGQGFENITVSLAVAGLVLSLWTSAATRSASFLAVTPLPYLGRISYGLYVFHLPCLVLAAVWFSFLPFGHAVPALAMTIGLAALSWRFVEGPINAQKRRFPMLPPESRPVPPAPPTD